MPRHLVWVCCLAIFLPAAQDHVRVLGGGKAPFRCPPSSQAGRSVALVAQHAGKTEEAEAMARRMPWKKRHAFLAYASRVRRHSHRSGAASHRQTVAFAYPEAQTICALAPSSGVSVGVLARAVAPGKPRRHYGTMSEWVSLVAASGDYRNRALTASWLTRRSSSPRQRECHCGQSMSKRQVKWSRMNRVQSYLQNPNPSHQRSDVRHTTSRHFRKYDSADGVSRSPSEGQARRRRVASTAPSTVIRGEAEGSRPRSEDLLPEKSEAEAGVRSKRLAVGLLTMGLSRTRRCLGDRRHRVAPGLKVLSGSTLPAPVMRSAHPLATSCVDESLEVKRLVTSERDEDRTTQLRREYRPDGSGLPALALEAQTSPLSVGIAPQEERCGFGKRPLEVLAALLLAAGGLRFAVRRAFPLDQVHLGGEALDAWRVLEGEDLVDERQDQDSADAWDGLEQVEC